MGQMKTTVEISDSLLRDAQTCGARGSDLANPGTWPCLYEFLSIVTHPRIYPPPTPFAPHE
jgi:hypothetical protein